MKRKSVDPSSANATLSAVVARRQAGAWRRFSRHSAKLLAVGAVALVAAASRGTFHATPTDVVIQRAIDGDTVDLSDGRHLRYIGIDTPDVRRRRGDRWVEEPEPFGREASARNRQLVEGKRVRLEFDVQKRDRYGRLLAYVHLGDLMVNAELMQEGFAQPMTIPPNVKHAELFRRLAQEARQNRRGLWRLR